MRKTADFFNNFTKVAFNKGDILISEGTNPPGAYYISSGFVRQYIFTEGGQELTLNFFKPGSFFPMFWVINNLQNKHFFQAFTSLECFLAPKDEVINFLKSNPDVLFDLTSRLLSGLDGLLTRVEALSSLDAKARVSGMLLFLAKHFGESNGQSITLKEHFTHQDIANLTGLTRETTSRELEKLEREHILSVTKEKKFTLHKPEALSR